MYVVCDWSPRDFTPWCGAISTLEELTWDEFCAIWDEMENAIFYEGYPTETEVNDFLWFETDQIAEILGWNDWEDLVSHRDERNATLV